MSDKRVLREITAYVRPELLDAVVRALEGQGVCQMMVEEVKALIGGVDTIAYKYSLQLGGKYSTLAKIELVCPEQRSDRIVQSIAKTAHLGEQGDGFIFVTGIVDMVDIRTGTSLADQSDETEAQCA